MLLAFVCMSALLLILCVCQENMQVLARQLLLSILFITKCWWHNTMHIFSAGPDPSQRTCAFLRRPKVNLHQGLHKPGAHSRCHISSYRLQQIQRPRPRQHCSRFQNLLLRMHHKICSHRRHCKIAPRHHGNTFHHGLLVVNQNVFSQKKNLPQQHHNTFQTLVLDFRLQRCSHRQNMPQQHRDKLECLVLVLHLGCCSHRQKLPQQHRNTFSLLLVVQRQKLPQVQSLFLVQHQKICVHRLRHLQGLLLCHRHHRQDNRPKFTIRSYRQKLPKTTPMLGHHRGQTCRQHKEERRQQVNQVRAKEGHHYQFQLRQWTVGKLRHRQKNFGLKRLLQRQYILNESFLIF